MTMLSNRLNLIEESIIQKEALIEQLRVEISQMQQHVHAVKGVSELCENLRALALQTWMSVYTVCPEEEDLIMQELEQARLDAKSKVEMGIAQLPEMVEPKPETQVEAVEEENLEEQPAIDVDVVEADEPSSELTNVTEVSFNDSATPSETLKAADLDKDHLEFAALKKLASSKGVKARKRSDIERELLGLDVTRAELEEVLADMEF